MRNLIKEMDDMKRLWFEEGWEDDWHEGCQDSIDLAKHVFKLLPKDILDAKGDCRYWGDDNNPYVEWKISGNIYAFWGYPKFEMSMAFLGKDFYWYVKSDAGVFHYKTKGFLPNFGIHEFMDIRKMKKECGL